MNAKTYNKFKNLLISKCDKHIKNGGKIISGVFTIADSCCPISCALGTFDMNKFNHFDALNKKLGTKVPERQYWQFINGFDGNTPSSKEKNTQLFKLGRALRKKYISSETNR